MPSDQEPTTRAGWLFGKHAVIEALRAGEPVERIYLAEHLPPSVAEEIREASPTIRIDSIPKEALERYARGIHHQGIAARIAVVPTVDYSDLMLELANVTTGTIVALDGIADPGNAGAIVRSAAAFGAQAVLLCNQSAPLSPAMAKSSAGGIFQVPIVRCEQLAVALRDLKNAGYFIYASAEEATDSLLDCTLPDRLVWVIGSEESGVSPSVRKVCDAIVRIPTTQNFRSLNASVATGILLYTISAAREMAKDDQAPSKEAKS